MLRSCPSIFTGVSFNVFLSVNTFNLLFLGTCYLILYFNFYTYVEFYFFLILFCMFRMSSAGGSLRTTAPMSLLHKLPKNNLIYVVFSCFIMSQRWKSIMYTTNNSYFSQICSVRGAKSSSTNTNFFGWRC